MVTTGRAEGVFLADTPPTTNPQMLTITSQRACCLRFTLTLPLMMLAAITMRLAVT